MKIVRRIHVRAVLIAVVVLVVIGSGAAYAATRTTTRPIGTGIVVIDTNLAYQGASAAGIKAVLLHREEEAVSGVETIRNLTEVISLVDRR